MPANSAVKPPASTRRRLLASGLLAAGACGLFGGCATLMEGPEMTPQRQCEIHHGWWRGDLIPGYCEYQSASLQSP
jgi:hypothetical protein